MKNFIKAPVTSAIVERIEAEAFRVGVCEINGWRAHHEDAHIACCTEGWGFFGVFDGHCGAACSKFAAQRITELLYSDGCPSDDLGAKRLMLRVDDEFLSSADPSSGSTAACCIIRPAAERHLLHVVNAGDSRVLLGTLDGVLVDGGGTDQALTTDHNPANPAEAERIYRCGGHVERSRVNGSLAVSRALGDAPFKRTGGPSAEDRPVTADPQMGHFECGSGEFVVLACDGIFEGIHNSAAVAVAARVLRETGDLGGAAQAVCQAALAAGSKDNVTCMVVQIGSIGGDGQMNREYVPGVLDPTVLSDAPFIAAYSAMAARAGLGLSAAVQLRFDFAQGQLLDRGWGIGLQKELAAIGVPEGALGSSKRTEWFTNWADRTKANCGRRRAHGESNRGRILDAARANAEERRGNAAAEITEEEIDTENLFGEAPLYSPYV